MALQFLLETPPAGDKGRVILGFWNFAGTPPWSLALSGSVQFVQSVVDGVVKVFGYFARWWLG